MNVSLHNKWRQAEIISGFLPGFIGNENCAKKNVIFKAKYLFFFVQR